MDTQKQPDHSTGPENLGLFAKEVPSGQPSPDDIRAGRLDELRKLESEGTPVIKKGTAQELGDRAVHRAEESAEAGVPVSVRQPNPPDEPVFH